MKKRFFKIFLSVALLSFLLICNNVVFAATATELFKRSLEDTGKGTGHLDADGATTGFLQYKTLPQAIGSVVGIGLSLLGVFFLMLIIYAGYTWMLARGNAPEVEKAKSTIINAVIGLVIVLVAYTLTTFIGTLFFE